MVQTSYPFFIFRIIDIFKNKIYFDIFLFFEIFLTLKKYKE